MSKGKKRQAEGRFNRFIQGQEPISGLLPLTHITRAYSFDDMLSRNNLEPQRCDVFKEQLIYLFYGRPAYRAKDGNNARLEFDWPIVFIFDPNKVGKIKRIFPFDTGAFAEEFYESFFHSESQIEDFAVDSNLESAQKIVGTFYLDNAEYLIGGSRKNVEIPHRQFEVQGVFEMARNPSVPEERPEGSIRDERSSTIEMQVDRELDLVRALIAIVLPGPYLDDDDVRGAVARWNPQIIETYQTLHNMGGEAWTGAIYEIVRRIYNKLGYLDRGN